MTTDPLDDRQKAQELFDLLMAFNYPLNVPKKVLVAVDTVADYLGDIAKGRI